MAQFTPEYLSYARNISEEFRKLKAYGMYQRRQRKVKKHRKKLLERGNKEPLPEIKKR